MAILANGLVYLSKHKDVEKSIHNNYFAYFNFTTTGQENSYSKTFGVQERVPRSEFCVSAGVNFSGGVFFCKYAIN